MNIDDLINTTIDATDHYIDNHDVNPSNALCYEKADLAIAIRTALRAMRDHCADVARDRPFDAEGWIRRIEV